MNTEQVFTREIKVVPAWDSGTREKGQHCAELLFFLHGTKGVLLFNLYTGWCINPRKNFTPTPANVSYHSYYPLEPDDDFHETCAWIGGKPCYSDSLYCSTEMFAALTERGTEGLWEEMETLYHKLFDKEPEWRIEPYEQMAAAVSQ